MSLQKKRKGYSSVGFLQDHFVWFMKLESPLEKRLPGPADYQRECYQDKKTLAFSVPDRSIVGAIWKSSCWIFLSLAMRPSAQCSVMIVITFSLIFCQKWPCSFIVYFRR